MKGFIISWLIVGLISTIAIWISDMRGQKYNKNYFDTQTICYSIVICMLGYISLLLVCLIYGKETFTRLIYKIANSDFKK